MNFQYLKSFLLMAVLVFGNALSAEDSEINPFDVKSFSEHEVQLLNHGLASLEARLQMIERAEKTIDVEYFIYRPDESGQIFTHALIKKAREGVKVRILLDYFMVKKDFGAFHAHELKEYGIEVKYFNTTHSLNLLSGQYRNHRKVLIIDGIEAMTGGRNIGNEYFDMSKEFNFLDRDLIVKGEIVSSIQKTFDIVWSDPKSEFVKRDDRPELTDGKYNKLEKATNRNLEYQVDLKAWNKKVEAAKKVIHDTESVKSLGAIRSFGARELEREFVGKCNDISFHSEYPIVGSKNRSQRVLKHDLYKRISEAKTSVLFDSPYFIVDKESAAALDKALNNNVKVELLTNSLFSTDAIYVYTVFDSIVKDWIKKGVRPYIFKADAPDNYNLTNREIRNARFGVHAKTFIFDEKDVSIGTFNFDPRSANFNTEMTVTCNNAPELAKAVEEDIRFRIEGSIFLDSEKSVEEAEFYKTNFQKKLLYYFLKLPSNWLDHLLEVKKPIGL